MDSPIHLWRRVARFTLVHLVVYLLVAFLFGFVQVLFSAPNRAALEHFQPYGLEPARVFGQTLRGMVLALILYPAYDRLVFTRRGGWVLFGLVWGASLVGSVEPIPGSIEGVIYTVTSVPEHLLVLAAGALQTALFCLIYVAWERRVAAQPTRKEVVVAASARLRSFLTRFTLVHVVTYMLAGIVFMTLQDYGDAFATQAQFALFRPLDDPMMAAVLPIQLIRGALLAVLFFPLYHSFIHRRPRWLRLFALIFGLTALGSALLLPDIASMVASGDSLLQLVVGIPEITVQMLLFAWMTTWWEGRAVRQDA